MATRSATRSGIGRWSTGRRPERLQRLRGRHRRCARRCGREGAEWAEPRITTMGASAGLALGAWSWGAGQRGTARVLQTTTATAAEVDEVEFHPAWHRAAGRRPSSTACTRAPGATRGPAPTSRAAAGFYLVLSQAEAGPGCPISMTFAAVPALRAAARAGRDVGAARCPPSPTTRACAPVAGQGRRAAPAWR